MTVCILNAPTASEAGSVTVTTHVAVFPLNVFTVITALPADTAVILPLESTVATLVLPEVIVVPALAQFSPISAVSAKVLPFSISTFCTFKVMESGARFTVTVAVAVTPL